MEEGSWQGAGEGMLRAVALSAGAGRGGKPRAGEGTCLKKHGHLLGLFVSNGWVFFGGYRAVSPAPTLPRNVRGRKKQQGIQGDLVRKAAGGVGVWFAFGDFSAD